MSICSERKSAPDGLGDDDVPLAEKKAGVDSAIQINQLQRNEIPYSPAVYRLKTNLEEVPIIHEAQQGKNTF